VSAMPDSPKRKVTLERVYVWELPVRLTHWVLFFSILVLSATGYYIANPFLSVPGEAKDHFVMGTVRTVHLYAAIVFTLAVLIRIYWFFAGNKYARLSEFIPLSRRRWRSLWRTFQYYSFLRHEPDDYAGHNALASATYLFIIAIYLLLIATGLALYTVYASISSPFQVFDFLVPLFDGLQVARLIHHIGMWVVLIFAVVHVYFVFLSSTIEHIGTFDSIFSGFKFMPQQKVDRT
jgi:Ni/Fe-hydrogenase 1 B-type cytochrome subunit